MHCWIFRVILENRTAAMMVRDRDAVANFDRMEKMRIYQSSE